MIIHNQHRHVYSVVRNPALSSGAARIYAILGTCEDKTRLKANDLQAAVGCSGPSFKKYLRELEALDFLVRTKDHKRRWIYVLGNKTNPATSLVGAFQSSIETKLP